MATSHAQHKHGDHHADHDAHANDSEHDRLDRHGHAEQHDHHRPIWRGFLRLALVSCPVALYSARHASAELHFHLINPKTGNRVRMITLDASTDQEVSRSELVKGYEFKKDTYVILDDADFERAKVESSTVMSLDKFVSADAIDPVYYDDSYYVLPDGDAGEDVYPVLREAMTRTGRVALSRVVLARRERSVAIMPMGKGVVLHTLHDPKDINDPQDLFSEIRSGRLDNSMVKLAIQLMKRQESEFRPDDMEDRYEARLREVIAAKLRGEEEPEPEEEPDRSNVIDLMTALKQSLGQHGGKAPAKTAAKPASKPATKRPAPGRSPAKPKGKPRTTARGRAS
jgi:DNA end-binding protein Ku